MSAANALPPASIVVITGIMAAGKSTIAQALAEQQPQSVHLRGDLFRRMIVNGRAPITAELSAEANRQLQLRYELASQAALTYVRAGFTVVYQDILVGQALADMVLRLQGAPLYVVALCPSAEVAAARDRERTKTGYSEDFSAELFDRIFRAETPRIGLWVDTSVMMVAQTVAHIGARMAQARIA